MIYNDSTRTHRAKVRTMTRRQVRREKSARLFLYMLTGDAPRGAFGAEA